MVSLTPSRPFLPPDWSARLGWGGAHQHSRQDQIPIFQPLFFFLPSFLFFLVYMIIFFFIPFRSMSGSLPRSSRLCSPLRRRRHGLSKPQSSAVDRPRLPGQPADRPRRLYACLYPSYKKKKKKTFLINKHSCATNENSKTRTRRRIISPSFIS